MKRRAEGCDLHSKESLPLDSEDHVSVESEEQEEEEEEEEEEGPFPPRRHIQGTDWEDHVEYQQEEGEEEEQEEEEEDEEEIICETNLINRFELE